MADPIFDLMEQIQEEGEELEKRKQGASPLEVLALTLAQEAGQAARYALERYRHTFRQIDQQIPARAKRAAKP